MYYAGNGRLLIGFEERKHRDYFVKEQPLFHAERAISAEAKNYPQFNDIRRVGECIALNPDGYHDRYWSDVAYNTVIDAILSE